MGATDFSVTQSGHSASEAFQAAVREAKYEHGHARYTGTVAEKRSFVTAVWPTGWNVSRVLEELSDPTEHVFPQPIYKAWNDKWGAAVCLEIPESLAPAIQREPGTKWYLFCGLASC